jgi:hypothetical protein
MPYYSDRFAVFVVFNVEASKKSRKTPEFPNTESRDAVLAT